MSIMHKVNSESSLSRPAGGRRILASVFLAVLLGIGIQSFALASENSFSGARETVPSTKSFEEVSNAVKSLVARNGMMVMAQVNQGKMLSMTGLKLKATLFLVGNPTVGKRLFAQNHGVGLYVPLRLFVYTGADGRTYVSYDRPSALLSQFGNEKIRMVAQMLDKKLEDLASMAAR